MKPWFEWLVIKDEVVFNRLAVNLSLCRRFVFEAGF